MGSARRLSATKSSTASTCSRGTSNCSMTSSMLRSLEVLDDGGDREPRALEHPSAAYLAWDALDDRALGPVECCHGLNSSLQLTATRLAGHVGAHAARRSPSTCGSHRSSWFQRENAAHQLAPYWHQQLRAANNPIVDNTRTSSSVSSRPSTVIRCEMMNLP